MNKIQEYRKLVNLTQSDFAKALNITQGAIGHYETGRNTPSLEMSRKIIRTLNEHGANCTLDDVFPNEK